MLMAFEVPILSMFIARLPNPEVNLAAFGGIAFPLLFIIEAPVEMLLAASTALSKDWASYLKLRKFVLILGFGMTVMHFLLAFTPLYYLVVQQVIHAPAQVIEPARNAFKLLTFFTFAVAYRRFQQGVLIRFGHSRAVGVGTLIRLSISVTIFFVGQQIQSTPAATLAAGALICGAICEALYSRWRVQPVLIQQVRPAPAVELLTWKSFFHFYIPLAATTLILFLFEFISSSAISRMPQALDSLAIWPILGGLIFIFQSMGVAYNEVVVALVDRPGSSTSLRRFAVILAAISTVLALLLAVTPLSLVWFRDVSALSAPLAKLAKGAFSLAILFPAISVFQSWFQGVILFGRKTRAVTEAVVIALVSLVLVLVAGVTFGKIVGIYVGTGAYVLSTLVQTFWLWLRSREVRKILIVRDTPK
jgi:hypothetical protein